MTKHIANSLPHRQVIDRAMAPAEASRAVPHSAPCTHEDVAGDALKHPADKYSKRPFRRQSQLLPPLAGKMDPRPGHGGTTSSGRIAERKVILTGGDSRMAPSSVIGFARDRLDVAMNHLPAEEADVFEVNGVAPGPVWTALQMSCGAWQQKLDKLGSITPHGRVGQPTELGSISTQLAANDASFADRQIYRAAGGDGQPGSKFHLDPGGRPGDPTEMRQAPHVSRSRAIEPEDGEYCGT